MHIISQWRLVIQFQRKAGIIEDLLAPKREGIDEPAVLAAGIRCWLNSEAHHQVLIRRRKNQRRCSGTSITACCENNRPGEKRKTTLQQGVVPQCRSRKGCKSAG